MPPLRPLLLCAVLLGLLLVPASAPAIVGGETTQRSWPHMAGMEFKAPDESDWGLRCGGSLIRPDVVLTAAHCVDAANGGTEPASQLRFLLGTKKRSSGGERIGAVQILEHPNYDATGGGAADVALVKLARASTLGTPIRIAGPGDAAQWQPGDPAVVTGWGTEVFGAPTVPDDLKEAEVPIVSDADCQTAYRFTLGFDPETNVCAGNLTGGEDSCQGDSGGPLHVQDARGAWIQVGVVSYGLGCAFPTQYGVYSEAGGDALRGWIAQHADAMAAPPAPAAVPAPSGGGSSAPPAGGATIGSSSDGATAPLRARLTLPARLRVARAARRLAVTLHTSGPLRKIVLTLRRGGRTLAVGRRASLRTASGRIALKARTRRTLRPGRATLRLTAIDASGKPIAATRTVHLTPR